MKRILFLIVLLSSVQIVLAKNYESYCAQHVPSKTPAGIIASITGINGIIRGIISMQVEKAVLKETNSKAKVKIDNFFGVNLSKGEFESFKLNSKNIFLDGLYFTNFNLETVCRYNKINYTNNTLVFPENTILKYSAQITQDDINKSLEGEKYKKLINEINSNSAISSVFKIQNSNIKIKDNKLALTYIIAPKGIFSFSKPVKLSLSAGLEAKDGQIKLCNIKTFSNKFFNDTLLSVINSLDLLNRDVLIDKNTTGKLEIQDVKIQNSTILLNGYLIILKNQNAR